MLLLLESCRQHLSASLAVLQIRPRDARFRISAVISTFHGGATSHVTTVLTSVPNFTGDTRTTSPDLVRKAFPPSFSRDQ
jgi:hypothetical protein